MGEEVEYTGTSGVTLLVPGPDKVSVDAFTFVSRGEVIGTLRATYDFTELDPSLHKTALSMIREPRMVFMNVGPLTPEEQKMLDDYKYKQENNWFKRILKRWMPKNANNQ